MRELLRQLLTESNNITPDLMKYLAVGSIITSWGMQAYAIYQGQHFNMQDFGMGQGALFAGVGVALALKKETQNA